MIAFVVALGVCAPAGEMLRVKQNVVDKTSKEDTYTLVVTKTGAWTTTVGKTKTTGCDKALAATITAAFKSAKWKVTHAKPGSATCRAYSPYTYTFSAYGRAFYTQVTCGLDSLDEKSEEALEKIWETIGPLVNKRRSDVGGP